MYGKSVKSNAYMERTYQLVTEIGSGSSGAAYLAWHTRLRKLVVIKTSNSCIVGRPDALRNEVEALKNIKSMYIPQVLDFLEDSDTGFTVMEYIEGESFDKLLKCGQKLTETQIVRWYCQLSSALATIHRHNVYHRDIKPSNIMLTKSGDVCLIDFNSALVSGVNTGVISRSMGYASPEQYEYFKMCKNSFTVAVKAIDYVETMLTKRDCITGIASDEDILNRHGVYEIDWKLSDIYSLGATMFHFLTGNRPPVRADEVSQIPLLDGYSKDLLSIIECSMRFDPSQRFLSAEDLGNALSCVRIEKAFL